MIRCLEKPLIPGRERARKTIGVIEERGIVNRHHLLLHGERAGGARRPEWPAGECRQAELFPQMAAGPFAPHLRFMDRHGIPARNDLVGIALNARQSLHQIAAVDAR
jgi:hypothetical protein